VRARQCWGARHICPQSVWWEVLRLIVEEKTALDGFWICLPRPDSAGARISLARQLCRISRVLQPTVIIKARLKLLDSRVICKDFHFRWRRNNRPIDGANWGGPGSWGSKHLTTLGGDKGVLHL
jgi:hypothetical protein